MHPPGYQFAAFIVGTISLLLAACPAFEASATEKAGTKNVPVAHGEIVRDFARITFEWPRQVYFTASAKGKTLSITFDHKANPDFGALLTQMHPYVVSAERKADGKTLVLTLDKPYRIRTFVSDTINGVDLLGVDLRSKRRVNVAADVDDDPATARRFAALSPAAGEETPPIEAASPAAPAAEAPTKQVPAVEMPVTTKPEEAAPAQSLVPVEKTAASTPVEGTDSTAIPGGPKQVAVTENGLKVGLSAAEDNAIIRFPFTERTATAIFTRAGMLWIVWHKPMAVDLSDFNSMPHTVIGKPQKLRADTATILRFPIEDNLFVSVVKEQDGASIAVLVTPKERPLASALKITLNTEPPAPANVLVTTLEMADPITVTDPLIGDQMVITPVFNTGEGIADTREFVEFTLLKSAQGIAVGKKSDDVTAVSLRNGLRIATPQGATLTPSLPEPVPTARGEALESTTTLFPYERWKSETPDKINRQIRELQHQIVESDTPQGSNEARLRLAQLYLADGWAVEALGLLDGINRNNPAFYRSSKLSALRGAANFLMYRFADSSRDFSAAELNNNKEAAYWRSMLADLLGSSEQTYDYLALNTDYISKYPPLFRQRLAIVAADRNIAAKEYNVALKIFDALHDDNLLNSINSYINFLLAKISIETGQTEEGYTMLDKLANDSTYPFVQVRAEFSRIAADLDKDTYPREQAVERLEHLRLNWHGDGLELSVLKLLGDLYAEKKDFVNAMRVWHNAVTGFPNTAESVDMGHKMQDAFIHMFSDGGAESMPTVDALAMYYEYRNYTPGGSAGSEIINQLANRLMSVDLLSQAATLLEYQMRAQSEKDRRSELGAKLATIYMLNHEPEKALNALQDSMYGENALLVRLYRNRLTADAMARMGQLDKAMQTLGQDGSADAEQIRLNIYWQQKNWGKVIEGVEALLKSRPNSSAPITVSESEYLLKLALAYIFENNPSQLQYLRDYFGPLMKDNPNKEVFNFITNTDITPNTNNFDDIIVRLGETKSFIENYSARIKTAGLDSMVKEDKKKTN